MAGEADSARLRLLYELGCAFTARIELTELLPLIIEKCREALAAEGVAVLLLDRVRNEFYFPYVADTDSEVARRLSGHRFSASLGFAGLVVTTGQSLIIRQYRHRSGQRPSVCRSSTDRGQIADPGRCATA